MQHKALFTLAAGGAAVWFVNKYLYGSASITLKQSGLPIDDLSKQQTGGEVTGDDWQVTNKIYEFPGSYVPNQFFSESCNDGSTTSGDKELPALSLYSESSSGAISQDSNFISEGFTEGPTPSLDAFGNPNTINYDNGDTASFAANQAAADTQAALEFDSLVLAGPRDISCFVDNENTDMGILDVKKGSTRHLWGQPVVTVEGGDDGPFGGMGLSSQGPYVRAKPMRPCGN